MVGPNRSIYAETQNFAKYFVTYIIAKFGLFSVQNVAIPAQKQIQHDAHRWLLTSRYSHTGYRDSMMLIGGSSHPGIFIQVTETVAGDQIRFFHYLGTGVNKISPIII